MTRLYISGPVTGIEADNYEAFDDASFYLRRARYEATIPHDFVLPYMSHEVAMAACIHQLTSRVWDADSNGPKNLYDGLALLPGWEQSEGARLEKAVAEACGILCKTVDEWIEETRVRDLRSECHKLFDRTWKTKDERKDCYVRLSRKLGITLGECHFSTMSAELLERALEILKDETR